MYTLVSGVRESETTLLNLSSENSMLENEHNISDAREWCTADPEFPPRFPFTSQRYTNFNMIYIHLRYNTLKNIFDDQLIHLITNKTNRYSSQYTDNNIGNWTPVTNNDMRVFLALVILQST